MRLQTVGLLFTLLVSGAFFATASSVAAPPITNTQEFAPQEGMVAAAERPLRDEICLNGRWQFQPISVPKEYVRDQGVPPALPQAKPSGWDRTPIKIPSAWNVNTWGGGRDVGQGTAHPYWPDSVTYPSYPASWDNVEMGWLRRSFTVPTGWKGKRLQLRFASVAGECQVYVGGRKVGEHFDSYTPFQFDITDVAAPGKTVMLRVGVRRRHLFNKTDARYPYARAPYPLGSNTDQLGGIWQDVSLAAVAPVYVADTFVKPLVARDKLDADVTVTNTTAQPRRVTVGGKVAPWVNLAGKSVNDAPVPRGKLAATTVLTFPTATITIPANSSKTVTLSASVKNKLRLWTPNTPNLNGLVVSVAQGKQVVDRHYTRFGWRQLTLRGQDLLLNGKKIQLFGDLVHPFGAWVMTRRYPWAWYRMVKEYGGNAVRLHAQPMPSFYLDLADEMGVMVLDETALFGSSLQLNFAEPVAWERFARHYDDLVLRDRNHPSVFGWSFGNELFAIFEYNKVPKEQADQWYAQLADLGKRALKLDPTRQWISCDGDEDLRGTLPVWSKHQGHGLHVQEIPSVDKPRMIGESGGTYYAMPPVMAEFNGDRAYESYRGRSEALAIDLYQNVTQMARPKLSFYSPSEMVWFGLEPLPYGYRDFARLPTRKDGITFTAPFREGKPGWQVERIPPYAATLNPGWDKVLPLYRPLPLFDAMKAALAPGHPAASPWDHKPTPTPRPTPPTPTLKTVGFVGTTRGRLWPFLLQCGVPLVHYYADSDMATSLVVVDGATIVDDWHGTNVIIRNALERGSTVLFVTSNGVFLDTIGNYFPAPFTLIDRKATQLVPKAASPWLDSLSQADLYFAQDGTDKFISWQVISGPFVEQGTTLLEASNTDWSQFEAGESVKVGAMTLYEQLKKPAGAVLVTHPHRRGTVAVTSISTNGASPAQIALWRKLLGNMGVILNTPQQYTKRAFAGDTLMNALSIGRFGAASKEAASSQEFISFIQPPKEDEATGGLTWKIVNSPSEDRFMFPELNQVGPEKAYAVYFSFWMQSPRDLSDLLGGGPDTPQIGMRCFVSEQCKVYLNGKEVKPAQQVPADYRTQYIFEGMPLKKDWNHILIKVVSDHLGGDHTGTLAVRLFSNNPSFISQLESAVTKPTPVSIP